MSSPHERAATLGDATTYTIDVRVARGLLSIVAKVNSFKPDEFGMVHLIGAHRIIEAEKGGKVIAISLVPLVAYPEATTTRLRADMIYSYARRLAEYFAGVLQQDGRRDRGGGGRHLLRDRETQRVMLMIKTVRGRLLLARRRTWEVLCQTRPQVNDA